MPEDICANKRSASLVLRRVLPLGEHWDLCALQVFADQRYQRHDKRDKLPAWITTHLKDSHLNLSADMLVHVAREFMRTMAQPYDKMAVGRSLLTEDAVNGMVTAAPTGMVMG